MSDLADIQWFSGESDGPKPAPKKCPLPRIGSKEWGWRHNKTEHTMDSSKCCYVVLCRNQRELADVWHAEGGPAVEGIEDNETAKRIAELLARRDWRRENRGKR